MVVWCCGMIRSGSTLQYNLAKGVIEGSGSGGYIHANTDIPGMIRRMAPKDGWWVNKSHEYQDEIMMPLIERGQASFVMIYRDLRDVMVSTLKFRGQKFNSYIKDFRKETVEREKLFLENVPGDILYRSRYEDVIEDAEGEARSIANHLGMNVNDGVIERVAKDNSLQKIKKYTSSLPNWDAHTRYAPRHVYTGGSGGWRERLTPRQIEIVEEEVGDWLVENGYELSGS